MASRPSASHARRSTTTHRHATSFFSSSRTEINRGVSRYDTPSSSASGSSFLRCLTPTLPYMRPTRRAASDTCLVVVTPQDRSTKVASSSTKSAKELCCDACDGKHETDTCPHFKKKRDKHRDAQKGKGASIGGSGGNFVLRRARVVSQPGDGNCLYHSMSYGLGSGSARTLRRGICSFIASNPGLEIAETPLRDWVRWDSNCSVSSYASRMSHGGWGGGIEMAACSRMNKVNVHVYEADRRGGGYKRISCFDYPHARETIHVLYRGACHYDALVPY